MTVDVEIHFVTDEGNTQVLFADMTQATLDELNAVISRPDAADIVLTIQSRVKFRGPTHGWLFRASRITLRKV